MIPVSFKEDNESTEDIEGVLVRRVHPAMFAVVVKAAPAWEACGATELVVTAFANGKHRVGSRHLANICTAVDLRTHNLPDEKSRVRARKLLATAVGPDFKVLYEYPRTPDAHIHVSYIADGKPA